MIGFHVVLDKPMTLTLKEANQLKEIALKNDRLICLTHTYTGYPMIKQARQMIKKGLFGTIRRIVVEYPQGWLSTALENTEQKQAAWRTDPNQAALQGQWEILALMHSISQNTFQDFQQQKYVQI